jgi:hypothetical protein
LGKRGSISSGYFLLSQWGLGMSPRLSSFWEFLVEFLVAFLVGWKREGRCRVLVSGVDLCGLQGTLIELDRRIISQQR